MEKLILNNEMIDIFRDLIDKEFVSYEGVNEFEDRTAMFGNVRLNFDNKSIEIEFFLEPKDFFGDKEDMVVISCKEIDKKSKFAPYVLNAKSTVVNVGEKIEKIKIIKDHININNSQFEYEYDQAIQFITKKSTYLFYKDWCFMELINIVKDKSIDEVNSIENEASFWSNEGEDKVKIKREIIELSSNG